MPKTVRSQPVRDVANATADLINQVNEACGTSYRSLDQVIAAVKAARGGERVPTTNRAVTAECVARINGLLDSRLPGYRCGVRPSCTALEFPRPNDFT